MNNHLTHQQMLAYLDGELAKPEMLNAKEHLHSCWSCRIEMERLESDIAVILDAHKENFVPAIPPPPGAWPSFNVLLARKLPVAPLPIWMRMGHAMRALLSPMGGAVLASMIGGLVLFTYFKLETKPVSAKEVLRSIRAVDNQRSSISQGQVIRERVHIRRRLRGQDQMQLGSIDAWKSPTTALWQTADEDSAVAALKDEYRVHGVPIDLPFSASSFDVWGKVTGGDPSITKQGTALYLSFPGASDPSTKAHARMNLRIQPGTWHVEQMTLEFSDASFEITEDDFSLVPTSAVPPLLLAELKPDLQPSVYVASHMVSDATASPVHLHEANLDQVQLNVIFALHRLHADLGEPVTVMHFRNKVEVGVWELPPDRQNEIRRALQDEPGVLIQAVPPVQRPMLRAETSSARIQPPGSIRITVPSEGEDQQLVKFFGGPEKEQIFTRTALAKSTVILAHLYALRNLQAQFPPEREDTLSLVARAQLASIIKDHAVAVSAVLGDLRSQLLPLDGAFNVAATPLNSGTDTQGTRWQNASLDALGVARAADYLLRGVLTSSDTPVAPDAALPELQEKLAHLAAEMRDLQKM